MAIHTYNPTYIIGDIMASMCVWFMVREVIKATIPRRPHNYISTIVAIIHNIGVNMELIACLDYYNDPESGDYPIEYIQIFSMSYYLYDMIVGVSPMYMVHHVITIVLLTYLRNVNVFISFLILELTNIGLYITYLAGKQVESSPTRTSIAWYKTAYIIELVLYAIRCAWLPYAIYININSEPMLVSMACMLLMGSVYWYGLIIRQSKMIMRL